MHAICRLSVCTKYCGGVIITLHPRVLTAAVLCWFVYAICGLSACTKYFGGVIIALYLHVFTAAVLCRLVHAICGLPACTQYCGRVTHAQSSSQNYGIRQDVPTCQPSQVSYIVALISLVKKMISFVSINDVNKSHLDENEETLYQD